MTITIRINRWFVFALGIALTALALLLAPGPQNVSANPGLVATNCPPAATPIVTFAAMQRYERGFMIWTEYNKTVYVMYDGPNTHFSGTFETYPDLWKEGMPETDPAFAPPPGKLQPTRGGGLVWRTYPKVRDGLGWGDHPPVGYTNLVVVQGNKMWLRGQGYDVFEFDGNTWKERDIWRERTRGDKD